MKSVYGSEYRAALKVLVEARKQAKLTQQQLSARLGKPQSFVSKYEHGERRLDVAEFLRVMFQIGADPHAALDEIVAAAPHIKIRARKRAQKR